MPQEVAPTTLPHEPAPLQLPVPPYENPLPELTHATLQLVVLFGYPQLLSPKHPGAPHVPPSVESEHDFGATPVFGAQVPPAPQNEHPPEHAETLQQTPSVQNAVAHWLAAVHAEPAAFVETLHVPLKQN